MMSDVFVSESDLALWASETHRNQTRQSWRVKQVLFHDKSEFQAVDIVDTQAYGRALFLDGMMMTTERDEFIYHELISHVPLLAHPNPKRVLIIGGGDGGTVREVVKHPCVEEVILCEIDGMVVDASRKFLPSIAGALDNPKVTLAIEDGVAYIANKASNFDLIIIDSTDPIGPGEGLFTEDFYRNVVKALNPDGMMVAQTENPMLCADIMQKVYPMYRRLFPIVKAYVGSIPTYPGGFWSWCFCSKQHPETMPESNRHRAEAIEKTCQYYNIGIQQAAFVLPNYVAKVVNAEPALAASH